MIRAPARRAALAAAAVAVTCFANATDAPPSPPAPPAAAPDTAKPAASPGLPVEPAAGDKASRSDVLRKRAAQLLLEGKADESASVYADALAADAGDETAAEGRVRALLAAGRWQQGLEEARRQATARPGSATVKSALGQALFRAGLLGEAASCLSPLATMDAPPARGLMTLGLVRAAEGNDDEGVTLLDRALALAPEDRDVILEAAGAAQSRAEAIARLTRYLDRSAGDDPDRIEGAKGTVRVYKALGERPVWVRATRPERIEVPLASVRHPSGALAGFVVEITPASGKPVRVLLDSGSTGLFMVDRIAVKAGFTSLAEETTFGGGGEGRHPTRTGLLPSAAIGALRFTDALVKTTTQEIEPTGRYHGVLGLSVFQGYRITIDLAREKLILQASAPGTDTPATQSKEDQATPSPAGSKSSAPPARGPAPPAGSPYWSVSSQMLVEAQTADGRSGLFLFDTGATSSLLALDFLENAPGGARLGGATRVQGYGGALRDAREVRGVRLRFQGLETSGAAMTASDLSQRGRLGGVEVSGYLGLDLLARTVVTVDTVARRVTVVKPAKR